MAATSVSRWCARLGWWALDYLAITTWQVRGVLAPADPEQYTHGSGAPVVLLPGIYETWEVFRPLAAQMHAHGHPVYAVPTLGYNHGPVVEMAERAARVIIEQDLRQVVLLAHSKGGLIGKHLMLRPDVAERVVGMVAVNTPFAGSRYASWLPLPSLRALSPRDAALRALGRQQEVHGRITSVYASFDPHVPGGSRLPGARNVEIPTTGHFRVLTDARVSEAVLTGLRRYGSSGG